MDEIHKQKIHFLLHVNFITQETICFHPTTNSFQINSIIINSIAYLQIVSLDLPIGSINCQAGIFKRQKATTEENDQSYAV